MPRNRQRNDRPSDTRSGARSAQSEFHFAEDPAMLESGAPRPGLVLADPTRLRIEWLQRYHEVEKKLNRLKTEWRRYEEEAQPGFQQWYHEVFFEEISLLNELSETIREKQMFFTAVEVNKRVYKLSDKQAYRKVMQALDEKRDPFPDPEDLERCRREEAEEREAAEAFSRQSPPPEPEQDSEDEHHESFEGEDSHSDEEGDVSEGAHEQISDSIRKKTQVSLLKSIYRKIVRTLHPDSGHQMTPTEKILWQQTQTAYKSNDLDTLKIISLKIEGKGNIVVSKVEQIGELMDLCKTLQQELASLQNLKERNKNDALYQFWISERQPKIRTQLTADILRNLGMQTYRLKTYLREANQELDFLAKKYR